MSFSAVDLPAPLGPIRPVTIPRAASKVAPSTAWTPPKSMCRSLTSRMFGASTSGRDSSAPRDSSAFTARRSTIGLRTRVRRTRNREATAPLRDQALGPPVEEGEDEHADSHELERLGDGASAEARKIEDHLHEDAEDERGAEHRAEVVPGPADDHGSQVEEGLRRRPRPGAPRPDVLHENSPAEACGPAADSKALPGLAADVD